MTILKSMDIGRMKDISGEEIRIVQRPLASQRNAAACHQCYFWSFVSLGMPSRKKLARILHELTIEFTQNMIKLFWVQQLCTASCLGRCAGS